MSVFWLFLPTAVPFLVVFLAVHPSTYRTAGLRRGTAASTSTSPGTTSVDHEGLNCGERVRWPGSGRSVSHLLRRAPMTRTRLRLHPASRGDSGGPVSGRATGSATALQNITDWKNWKR